MDKRERLQRTIAGEPVDRPPVALWRHWPMDDQTPEGLAEATVHFQREWDWDFIKVTPSSSFCLRDWGARDEWRGHPEGTRDYVVRPVQSPDDWARLVVLDPCQGSLEAQLTALERIRAALGDEVPVIQTVFSPLAQAKNLAGEDRLLLHLRRYPDALRRGLETITETTVRFVEAVRERGADGIFYAVQHARYDYMAEEEYRLFGRPYDLRILEAARGMWLNVLHLHGETVMLETLADYPVQVLHWHDREGGPALEVGQALFGGAVSGGVGRRTLVLGTPEEIAAEVADAVARTGGRRLILSTGCVAPLTTPWGNLRALRQAVERITLSGGFRSASGGSRV